ncbi:diguanylate cyclase (GGDEF)-like protein [Paenibacillus phyllosphaerae]|uniref:Diguanylate cyclase (GGDEF)-like protein n=1 Tax=Paenibacillus phyllosphaerae TaxID=274593 RepID=A0A7W5FNI5_9BACL|nr:diguanylate cyclase (GGDEF)-like protein [Paenibacillus phyllosphaerae]
MTRTGSSRRSINLAALLTGLVAVSILCTVIIQLIASYQSEKHALMTTTLALNASNAEKVNGTIGSQFVAMRASLKTTAYFAAHNLTLPDDKLQAQLELIRNTSRYFNSLSWVDESGVVRNIAPISIGIKGKVITEGLTKIALDSRAPYLSVPYIAPSGRLTVLFSEPVYLPGGIYRGLIAGTIYMRENNILYEILGENKVDSTGSYFFVVDPNGKLIYHPDKSRIGEDVSANPVVAKIRSGIISGQQMVTNTKGIRMLAAYVKVPESGWGVIQQTPVSAVYEQLYRNIRHQLLNMLIPFAVLLLLVIAVARRLARPFVGLADLVKQFSQGEHVALPKAQPHWNREADLLTKTVLFALETLERNNSELKHEASTDSLTGLLNRRSLTRILEEWMGVERSFAVLIMDIDHFKSVNDTYGHPAGDEVLKHIARLLRGTADMDTVCCRYGGEEFLLLLPAVQIKEAIVFAEHLRRKIVKSKTPIGIRVTVSIGIAVFPEHADTAERLIDIADKALYRAKQEGRNRSAAGSTSRLDTHGI